MPPRLILLLEYPVLAGTKPRLVPALGARGACALHRRLVAHALREARAFAAASGAAIEARVAGAPDEAAARAWLGDGVALREAAEDGRGARLARAVETAFAEGAPQVIVMAADCPGFSVEDLAAAQEKLANHDAVFGPAIDGGFYLLALRRPLPALFRGIRWGERELLAQMLAAARTIPATVGRLRPLHVVDVPFDLQAWAASPPARADGRDGVTVVIAAMGEEPKLEATLAAACAGAPHEIILVASATGRTAELAWAHDVMIVEPPPAGGIGPLNRGVAFASGEHLLFLPANSIPPADYAGQVRATLARPGVAAGAFALALAGDGRGRRWIERSMNARARRQLPCAEHGLFVRRDLLDRVGAFAPLAPAPARDFAFLRRLRRFGAIVITPTSAGVTAQRWQRLGPLRTTLANRLVTVGYRLGASPELLSRWQGA